MGRGMLLVASVLASLWHTRADCQPGASGVVTQESIDKVTLLSSDLFVQWLSKQVFPYSLQIGPVWVGNPHNVMMTSYNFMTRLGLPSSGETGGSISIEVTSDAYLDGDVQVLWCSGYVNAQVLGIRLNVVFDFDLVQGSLQLKLKSSTADIDDMHIIGGSCFMDSIGSWVLENFGSIKSQVRATFSRRATQYLPRAQDSFNQDLAEYSYQAPVPFAHPFDQLVLDFHICAINVRSSETSLFLELGITGEARDSSTPSQRTPLSAAPLPELDVSLLGHHSASLLASNYSLNTALYVWFKQAVLSLNVNGDGLPPAVQHRFNTHFFRVLIPELYRRYPDQNMSLQINVVSQPKMAWEQQKAVARTQLEFGFQVACGNCTVPLPVFNLTCPAVFAGSFGTNSSSGPVAVLAQLDELTGCAVSLKWSDVGKIGPLALVALERLANLIFQTTLIPQANRVLQKGVPIPEIVITSTKRTYLINIKNGVIQEAPGYAFIAADMSVKIASAFAANVTSSIWQGDDSIYV